MRKLARKRWVRRGTTLIETAAVALTCLIFMFGIFEYGRIVMMRQIMENAARAGGRVAVVTPTSYMSPAAANAIVNQAITDAMAGQDLVNLTTSIFQADNGGNYLSTWTTTPFGRNIVVQLDGDLPIMFPTFGFLPSTGGAPNSIHIRVKTMMRSEAN